MSYVEKTLAADEKVLFYTRPHYAIFYQVLIWLALALFMFWYVSNILGYFLAVIVVISFLGSLIGYFYSEYAITTRRVIMKVGFIRRRALELFLGRIEGVSVNQTVFGRILNYGTVTIIGIGGTRNSFFFIPKPLQFRNELQKHLERRY